MTLPIQTGYPDFGRFQAAATKRYTDTTFAAANGVQTLGPFYVGDIHTIGVRLTPTVNHVDALFDFALDQAMTLPLTSYRVQAQDNDVFSWGIPVEGPWVKVTLTPDLSPWTARLKLWQAAHPGPIQDSNILANVLFSNLNFNVNPGNAVQEGVQVWPAEANLYVELPGVSSAVLLEAVPHSGAATSLTRVVGTSVTADRRVFLPPMHLRLTLANAGGVPASFTAILTASPRID